MANQNNQEPGFLSALYSMMIKSDHLEIGQMLKNKCSELDISERALSDILNIERASLRRLFDGEAQKIDVVNFVKISQFLAIDLNELVTIYLSKLSPDTIKDIERTRKITFILSNFDVRRLAKSNFLKTANDYAEIEKRILEFFGLNSLSEYNSLLSSVAFSQNKRKFSNPSLQFWVAIASSQLRYINNPNEFNRNLLVGLVPKLRPLTRNIEKGLLIAAKALYEIGITVVFQSYLSGTSVRGATFFIKNKPCIVLTDLQKRYDSLWFALIHEIYHVLKDIDRIKESGYHLTGEEDFFYEMISEAQADEFARDLLLPKEKLDYLKDFIDVPGIVNEYAEKWNVHPSIIYGHYLREMNDENLYKRFNNYLIRPEKAIKSFLTHPWEYETIEEAAQKSQELFLTNLKQ